MGVSAQKQGIISHSNHFNKFSLTSLKLFARIIGRSNAMIADAMHSLSMSSALLQ